MSRIGILAAMAAAVSIGAGVRAQNAASAPGPAPAAPPTAADPAALERALQQADGPRRRILEAARLKAAPQAPAPPPPTVTVRARPDPGPLSVLPRAPEPVALPAVAAPLPAVAALPQADAAHVPPMSALPALALPPPVLLTLVEPQVPDRLLRRVLEVPVDMTVQPDGSVIGVAVDPSVPAPVAYRITEAVSQWRYAPQPAARAHRVTLVLRPS